MKHRLQFEHIHIFSGINSEIRKRIITGRPDSTNDWRYSVSLLGSNTACSEEYQRKGPPRFFHRRRPPAFRVLISTYYDPASFFSKALPLHPFASQYSGYCMNRGGRSSFFSLSIFFSRSLFSPSGYYETRFQRRRRRTVRKGKERGGGGDGKRRTCAREALSFSSARSFPAAFLPPVPCSFFLPFVRKASGAMKIRCSLFETYVRLNIFRSFDMSGDKIARDDRRFDQIVKPFIEN